MSVLSKYKGHSPSTPHQLADTLCVHDHLWVIRALQSYIETTFPNFSFHPFASFGACLTSVNLHSVRLLTRTSKIHFLCSLTMSLSCMSALSQKPMNNVVVTKNANQSDPGAVSSKARGA